MSPVSTVTGDLLPCGATVEAPCDLEELSSSTSPHSVLFSCHPLPLEPLRDIITISRQVLLFHSLGDSLFFVGNLWYHLILCRSLFFPFVMFSALIYGARMASRVWALMSGWSSYSYPLSCDNAGAPKLSLSYCFSPFEAHWKKCWFQFDVVKLKTILNDPEHLQFCLNL